MRTGEVFSHQFDAHDLDLCQYIAIRTYMFIINNKSITFCFKFSNINWASFDNTWLWGRLPHIGVGEMWWQGARRIQGMIGPLPLFTAFRAVMTCTTQDQTSHIAKPRQVQLFCTWVEDSLVCLSCVPKMISGGASIHHPACATMRYLKRTWVDKIVMIFTMRLFRVLGIAHVCRESAFDSARGWW